MKKLMTLFASAATLCAFSAANAESLTETGFETVGEDVAYALGKLNTAQDDNGYTEIDGDDFHKTWVKIDDLEDDVAIVTEYTADTRAAATNGTGFTDAELESNYLKLEGAPLITRYAQAGGVPVEISDGLTYNGLYIDTLVQFTATDPEEEVPTPGEGDKLCIWLADNEENPSNCTLMVTAGFVKDYDGGIAPTNYATEVKLANGSWHHLQVKVLAAIDSDQEDDAALGDGFVVIIDDVVVSTTECPFYDIDDFTLNPRAAKYMNKTAGSYKIFPSLVKLGGAGGGTITSLSFKGTGAVDNLKFEQGDDIDPILIPQALEPVVNGTEFTYTGEEIEAVSYADDAYGYEFEAESNIGTAVGEYRTTATPLYGYAWFDGSTTSKTYDWEIVSGGDTPTNWPDDPSTVSDKTAAQAYGITGDLANANAAQLATWAKGTGNVAFGDKGGISLDCFLLNIANSSSAADVQTAKDAFKVSISIVGETVTITTLPDGKSYNGTLTIYGSTDLTTPKANWDEKTTGDKFFYGALGL